MHPDCTVLRCATVRIAIWNANRKMVRSEREWRKPFGLYKCISKSPKKAFNARCFQYFFGANFCFFFLSKILLNMFSHRLTSTWLSNANRLAPRCNGIHQPRDKQTDRIPPCRPYCLHYIVEKCKNYKPIFAKATHHWLRSSQACPQGYIFFACISLEADRHTYSHIHHIWPVHLFNRRQTCCSVWPQDLQWRITCSQWR